MGIKTNPRPKSSAAPGQCLGFEIPGSATANVGVKHVEENV